MTKTRVLLPAYLLLCGCTAPVVLNPPRATSVLPPSEVLLNAEFVFEANEIPVEDASPARYDVRSGAFLVGRIWAGEPAELRVDCGVDLAGDPIARGGGIELNVEVDVGPPRASTSPGTRRTRVTLESWGEVVGGIDASNLEYVGTRCRLARDFAEELVQQIARARSGLPGVIEPSGRPGDPATPTPAIPGRNEMQLPSEAPATGPPSL